MSTLQQFLSQRKPPAEAAESPPVADAPTPAPQIDLVPPAEAAVLGEAAESPIVPWEDIQKKTEFDFEGGLRRTVVIMRKWRESYSWVRYSERGVHCSECKDVLVVSAAQLPRALRTLTRHEGHVHNRTQEHIVNKLSELGVAKTKEFGKLISALFFVAKRGMPHVALTVDLVAFFAKQCEDAGLVGFLEGALGVAYTSHESIRRLLLSIALVLEQDLLAEVLLAGSYSATADGSNTRRTPRTVATVRYVTHELEVRSRFLDLTPTADHTGGNGG